MASNENNRQSNQTWQVGPGPAGDDRSPRPPKLDTESRVLNIINKNNDRGQNSLQLPVVDSKLSADAKEFIPRGQTVYQDPTLYTDGSASLSVEAAEFYPGTLEDFSYNDFYQNADYDQSYLVNNFGNMALNHQGYGTNLSSTGDPVLDKFNETLYILNLHPANMEEYLRPICELIQRGQGGNTDVGNMVESLFEQSIIESNFRYTGARICQYLTTNLKDTPQFEGFHKTFIRRCQKEYEKRNDLVNGSSEEQERLRGLAMFMAEVFLNVQVTTEDGSVRRLAFLPRILMDLAQCVMSKPDDPNIKCVCQLFKLSGALIEDEVKVKPEECATFEEIFSRFQSLQESTAISEDAKFRITSVVNLKEDDWNRKMSSPVKNSTEFNSDLSSFQSQEPVFYNNAGERCSRQEANLPEEDYSDNFHVLTEEEEEAFKQFEEEQKRLVGDDTGYDSCNFGDIGGMGEEAEEAYEEFLQEQYQMLQQQQLQRQQQQPQQQISHNHRSVYHNQMTQPSQTFNHQQPPQNYYSYNPQQPPPSHHNYQQQQQPYSQQDQYSLPMVPGMNPQHVHQMNSRQDQLQYQQQQPSQQQQQHQNYQNPYGYQ
ncbi:hypothetical protein EGW08_016013 [Elysia chlorotica]|uniref:MIF4G domain-containing protein n=1 Tax=Elysia chlorotica TaxID=188477 RepID=A0A3S1B527_ELYCH|nr:hypothetical protein EGW08_016013 [Elysia chlorotica]